MKIKNSIRTKVLTGLLVGTALAGIGVSKSFADCGSFNNASSSKNSFTTTVSKSVSEQLIKEMEEDTKNRNGLPPNYWHFHGKDGSKCVTLIRHRGYLYSLDVWKNFIGGTTVIGDTTLYFSPGNGKAQTGWLNITDHPNGINGKYYFGDNFQALRNGFHKIYENEFLFAQNGRNLTGFQDWGGQRYYMDPSTGIKRNGGILNLNGNRYRFRVEDNGAMLRGWDHTRNGWMCYLPESGVMAPSGINYISSTNYAGKPPGYYCFKADGGYTFQVDGWFSEGGKRYDLDPSDGGRAHQNEFLQTTGRGSNITGRVYFGQDGSMAKGVTKVGDDTHVFIQTNSRDWNHYEGIGWYTDKSTGKRYFFNDGRSARSATNFRDTTPVGAAVKGKQVINGKTYEFDQNGVLK